MSQKPCDTQKKTSIGGQALIEGVMMRGPHTSAMAVRQPDGEISTETWETAQNKWYNKAPIIRGVVNFVSMMLVGYKCLMKSAEVAGFEDEGEPSKFDRWIETHLGDKVMVLFNILVSVIAVVLSVGLFMLLPSALVKLMSGFLPPVALTITEGVLKIVIFVAYLFLITRMKDIQRVFQYHGAEHKTIACYEAGDELTPENAKKHSRFHPRCGTSFLLIALVISILVFSWLSWDSVWMRVGLKIILLPLVVGISYEIIRFAGRHSNPITRAISAPGLWLQNLTTFEPDLQQLEVAIAAMQPCIPENENDDLF